MISLKPWMSACFQPKDWFQPKVIVSDNLLPPFSLIATLEKKHQRKRFRQSYVLLTDRIEIHQSQPLVWPSNLLYVMLVGCDWWISIRHVDNM